MDQAFHEFCDVYPGGRCSTHGSRITGEWPDYYRVVLKAFLSCAGFCPRTFAFSTDGSSTSCPGTSSTDSCRDISECGFGGESASRDGRILESATSRRGAGRDQCDDRGRSRIRGRCPPCGFKRGRATVVRITLCGSRKLGRGDHRVGLACSFCGYRSRILSLRVSARCVI